MNTNARPTPMPTGTDAAKAGYAALSAYQKQEAAVADANSARPGMHAASSRACASRRSSRRIRTAPAC